MTKWIALAALVVLTPAQASGQRQRAWEAGLGGDVGPLSWVLPVADDGSRLRTLQGSYRYETAVVDYRGSLLLMEERAARTQYVYTGTTSTQRSVLERDRITAIALFIDRHMPFPEQATLITSLGVGVVPWAQGRRLDPSQSGAALLTRTGSGSVMTFGIGARTRDWLMDAQLLLVRYNRAILGSNVMIPITISRRF